MARVAKYSKGAVGNLIAHYERRQKLNKRTGQMEYVKFGNRDIDTRWTPTNYRVWPPLPVEDAERRGLFVSARLQHLFDVTGQDPEEPAIDRFRRIFRETEHSSRRDLKCLCDWCISLPDGVPAERAEEFFDVCMEYCVRKYGAENIVGAWAHFDEAHRPHLHVAFVPVVTTTGTDGTTERRICAKEVLTRKHLSDWHGGLNALCQEELKIDDPGVINGRTVAQGGNRTVKQMKASDRAYERTKGVEVSKYRQRVEKALRGHSEANERGLLTNLLVSARDREKAQLIEPRGRTLKEKLTRR